MTKKVSVEAVHEIPREVFELLLPPPLLPTESESAYQNMLTVFARSIRPDDLITWMLVKDLADHRIEIARYRRFKASFITRTRREQIRQQIAYWSNYPDECEKESDAEAAQQEELLAKSNKTPEEKENLQYEINAKADDQLAKALDKSEAQVKAWRNVVPSMDDYADNVFSWIAWVERVDVLLQAAEKRFSDTLEEIERHRRGLGRLLREELDKIIEGEVVESQVPDQEAVEGQGPSDSFDRVSGHAPGNEASPPVPAQTSIDRFATPARRVRQSARTRAGRARPPMTSGAGK